MISRDVTTRGESKEKEDLTEKPIEKPPKKDTCATHPHREKKRSRQFYNTNYYRNDTDYRSSEDREKVKRHHQPQRGYWHNWNEPDYWDSETPRQYHYSNSSQSTNSLHHRRTSKKGGHKSVETKPSDETKGVKKIAEKEPTKVVTERNGEKAIMQKVDVSKVKEEIIAKDQSTVKEIDPVTDKIREKVKGEQDVNTVELTKTGQPIVKLSNESVDNPISDKSGEKVTKRKLDTKATKKPKEVSTVSADKPVTDGKVVKKKHKPEGTTAKTTDSSHHRKVKDPISDDNKETEKKKNIVIMVGKYQMKKFKPISTPSITMAEDDTISGTSISKVIPDKTANQTASVHSHKKRTHYNKAMKGSGRHHGGVAASLQSDVLSQQLSTGQYECMVCCERVRVKDPVWSCLTCYHIFHLKCIKKWARIPTNMEEG